MAEESKLFVLSRTNEPLRFILDKSVHNSRRSIQENIEDYGGIVLPASPDPLLSLRLCARMDERAILIVNPQVLGALRKKHLSQNDRLRVEDKDWLARCIRKGKQVANAEERVVQTEERREAKTEMMRTRPQMEFKPRMDYTAEDDELLVQYLAVVTPTINGRQSKTLYNQLFASGGEDSRYHWALNHSAESWRTRYKKNKEWFDHEIEKAIRTGRVRAPLSVQQSLKAEEEEAQHEEALCIEISDEEYDGPVAGPSRTVQGTTVAGTSNAAARAQALAKAEAQGRTQAQRQTQARLPLPLYTVDKAPVKFTAEDDERLCRHLAETRQGGIKSRAFYKKMVEEQVQEPGYAWICRHPAEGWRERFRRNESRMLKRIKAILRSQEEDKIKEEVSDEEEQEEEVEEEVEREESSPRRGKRRRRTQVEHEDEPDVDPPEPVTNTAGTQHKRGEAQQRIPDPSPSPPRPSRDSAGSEAEAAEDGQDQNGEEEEEGHDDLLYEDGETGYDDDQSQSQTQSDDDEPRPPNRQPVQDRKSVV